MSDATPGPIYCANHPDRETYLRCNRCDKPICTQCAVLTPTGYRCKECVRAQKKVYENSKALDLPLAFIVALILALIGGQIAGIFRFFTIFVAPIVGVVIAEAVRWVVRNRRSTLLFRVALGGVILGALPSLIMNIIYFIQILSSGVGVSWLFLQDVIWQGVYLFLVTSTAYYRLTGISIR